MSHELNFIPIPSKQSILPNIDFVEIQSTAWNLSVLLYSIYTHIFVLCFFLSCISSNDTLLVDPLLARLFLLKQRSLSVRNHYVDNLPFYNHGLSRSSVRLINHLNTPGTIAPPLPLRIASSCPLAHVPPDGSPPSHQTYAMFP